MTFTPSSTSTASAAAPSPIHLDPVEARVLATLMEKARTVPDSYPLTLNSLMLGCNQKTSRDPLMELDEAQVAAAIDALKSANLVRESSGGRSTRYEHNFQRGIGVFEQSAVLLGLLMLRGPQTAGELRLNSERWYKFSDISSVEGFLEELQDRALEKGGPLVVKLSRAPGTREQRWAHLLCGPVDPMQTGASGTTGNPGGGNTLERIERLETEVTQLRETVQKLCAELGMSPPGQT
ncbi:YceH family protein [Rhodoferax sp.]|uniref:YceH family protein n=1 Tax=Rhodoferax sp. TaxID=50421 RepID=UPI001EC2A8E4|nr:YceH family protein [Rhodoferax sp.]MBT9506191.1 YceH family protein [Rhodoferax sp.]